MYSQVISEKKPHLVVSQPSRQGREELKKHFSEEALEAGSGDEGGALDSGATISSPKINRGKKAIRSFLNIGFFLKVRIQT
jgi:hypothetical protein